MQSFKDLMTSELAAAGLSDDQVTTALEKIYSNEKLSPKLNALVKTATEDYQAQIGRVKQYQDWYPKAQAEYDRMAQETARVTAELQALQNGGGQPQFDPNIYVSKQDLQQMQIDMGRRYAGVIKDTAEITAEHVARFREKPDLNAVDELATKQGIPLRMAYEKWIEPRVKEQEREAGEKWKKDQRDEIERDLRSRYQLPVEAVAQEQAPMYRKNVEAPKDMDAELLEAWHSAPAKT
jgi:hypothetical protein